MGPPSLTETSVYTCFTRNILLCNSASTTRCSIYQAVAIMNNFMQCFIYNYLIITLYGQKHVGVFNF